MLVQVYLPEDAVDKSKVLNGLIGKYKTVTLRKDEDGRVVADCLELIDNKQYELHPTTGLPILLD